MNSDESQNSESLSIPDSTIQDDNDDILIDDSSIDDSKTELPLDSENESKSHSDSENDDIDNLKKDDFTTEKNTEIDNKIYLSLSEIPFTTKNQMTKYEFVRLLSEQTKLLINGAKILNSNDSHLSSIESAYRSIINSTTPLYIIRKLPTGIISRHDIKNLESSQFVRIEDQKL